MSFEFIFFIGKYFSVIGSNILAVIFVPGCKASGDSDWTPIFIFGSSKMLSTHNILVIKFF